MHKFSRPGRIEEVRAEPAGCSFRSFFLGGFECSTHLLNCGRRLDLIQSTQHDRFAESDYRLLKSVGIATARDGVRWHLAEPSPYRYDFSSAVRLIRAARNTGMQVIWDLFHYGWPDDLDIFEPEFLKRFGAFTREFARVFSSETDDTLYVTPVNEISYFAWGAGDFGCLNPFATGRGNELKAQLVRAHIAAIEGVKSVQPRARIVQVDPLVNVIPDLTNSADRIECAEAYNRAVYDAWDMVAGRRMPELGGSEAYVDIIGANYYVHNQWVLGGKFVERTHPGYRPLQELLGDLYRRYQRPLFIAETGIEDERRPEWLAYVCDEVVAALQQGIPIQGICLYPILNHPGWDDDRHCHNGLWDYCNDHGEREVYRPLADELAKQRVRIGRILEDIDRRQRARERFCDAALSA
jgi:beta-glucosidase/6-phospho-beta-glucosidase/beta-galactosidase